MGKSSVNTLTKKKTTKVIKVSRPTRIPPLTPFKTRRTTCPQPKAEHATREKHEEGDSTHPTSASLHEFPTRFESPEEVQASIQRWRPGNRNEHSWRSGPWKDAAEKAPRWNCAPLHLRTDDEKNPCGSESPEGRIAALDVEHIRKCANDPSHCAASSSLSFILDTFRHRMSSAGQLAVACSLTPKEARWLAAKLRHSETLRMRTVHAIVALCLDAVTRAVKAANLDAELGWDPIYACTEIARAGGVERLRLSGTKRAAEVFARSLRDDVPSGILVVLFEVSEHRRAFVTEKGWHVAQSACEIFQPVFGIPDDE